MKEYNMAEQAEWHYIENEHAVGPVTRTELETLAAEGRTGQHTLVWSEDLGDWTPLAEALPDIRVEPGIPCDVCGKESTRQSVLFYGNNAICERCKPAFAQRLREGMQSFMAMQYASFGRRAIALIIDNLLDSILTSNIIVLCYLFLPISENTMYALYFLIGLLVSLLYNTIFVGAIGATPGKIVLRLRIVRGDGRPIGYTRACIRYILRQVSFIAMGFGILIMFADRERRTLHDHVCDSRVIYQPPVERVS